MPARTASTVVIGVLAVLSCLLTAYVITVPVWVVFVGWASFFAAGGGTAGLAKSLLMSFVGVIVAVLVLLVVQPFGGSAWSVAVAVGIGAAILVALSAVKGLEFTPAGFLGFASTFGVLAAGGGGVLDSVSFTHPVVQVVVALLIGAFFGMTSGLLSAALTAKPAVPSATV
jgi:hypothetical protein